METEPQESNPQNDAVISAFCEITSASHQEARFFLESHNWDLDAAVSTFFENDAAAVDDATVAVTNPVPASHSLSPSPSHSPEYSPSQSPTRSRSPSPAPSRPPYQLRSKRAASGSSKEDNKPPAARTRGGIRTLSDLNRRPVKDGSDSDDDEPNEYYTGGEKSGMLVQDPTRGGAGDVDSIFAQARQFHQAPLEPSSSSRSFTGTARTLTGETVPAAAPPPPESINHTITFWNNGFTVDDGPLRRVDDPANAAFMESIKKSECPEELEPPSRMTTVEVSLIKREEDYREPVKQRSQAAFQGVGRTLGGSTSESAASESTAAAGPPLTTAPLPSMGLTVDQSLPSTSIQLRLADGTRMVSRFNNHHTIRDIHAFIDASRPGGMESERWSRVSKGREIQKMEGGMGNSNYYYSQGVMGSAGSSSGMLMPPPLVNSYATAAADQTSSSSNQQHCFVSLPFTNINPNQNGSQEYEMRMKTKVMGHPLFPRLLASYVNCQRVGAPAEVAARLEHAAAASISSSAALSAACEDSEPDPELDQFMEAYCEMLSKYHEELTKPFHEAMLGLSKINSQLKALSVSPSYSASTGDLVGQGGSSEEAGVNENCIDPRAKDWDIRAKLLQKYGGSLGSLSQELKKKKKNGKLPKEARVQLQEWWSRNYTWPYPSEPQKLALAASTGLTVKQINNWFINQRKRHWKPSAEGMQLAMVDHSFQKMVDHPHFFYNYMDHLICNPSPMDCTSTPMVD
ncbi:hypothetical protein ACLB2K_058468 [Fragaria x ananassa]